ncbi:MAG: ABC transporter substrate-binding protein [Pseudomonadota bacterium]
MPHVSIFVWLVLLASGTVLANDYPLTFTDDRGVEVSLKAKPERVATISIPAADMMVALGRPLIGITTYQGARPIYLGESVSDAIDFGELDSPNFELITAANIDLSIGMTRYNAPYEEEFERIGAFMTLDGFTLEDSFRSVEQMATALGEVETGTKMNTEFKALLTDYRTNSPGDVSVLLIWAYQDFLFGYQNNLLPAEFFETLSATNVLGRSELSEDPDNATITLEVEDILRHDPDVILVFTSHGTTIKANPAYEKLSAVRNGRIFAVGQQYTQPTGPIARSVVLREMAHLLYPETFEPPQDLLEAARAQPLQFAN